MKRAIRTMMLMLGVTLLVLPAAVSDGHQREHAKPEKPAKLDKPVKKDKKAKKVTYVFKGTFQVADSSVKVLKGNKHVRRADLVGESVAFDLSEARITVADVNGDGKRDLADVQDGDKVVVHARLPRTEPGAAPFAARKLVDQTHKKSEDEDKPEGEDSPEAK